MNSPYFVIAALEAGPTRSGAAGDSMPTGVVTRDRRALVTSQDQPMTSQAVVVVVVVVVGGGAAPPRGCSDPGGI